MTVTRSRVEFGDFQTPSELAREVCAVVSRTGFRPAAIIEPTCGVGAFLQAAIESFPDASQVVGVDRNPSYVMTAQTVVNGLTERTDVTVRKGDFFQFDWHRTVNELPEPLLVIGNPPWVTNSALGTLGSQNLPDKSNIDDLRGIEALTGNSNFDISECMLRQSLQWLQGRVGVLAVLCKTTVARKILAYAWAKGIEIESASIHQIDAKTHFRASVDACLLVIHIRPRCAARSCSVFSSLTHASATQTIGLREGKLVADLDRFERWNHLSATGLSGWRSGVKHDCSKVFELTRIDGAFVNGLNEQTNIEQDVVFPMLKSSDLASGRDPGKWMFVPQRSMSDAPSRLQSTAPMAWQYLVNHAGVLEKRGSSIYRNRPPFSIFGVGGYTFAPWKVAISGLYKSLNFVAVPPVESKPVVFDDTCYLFPCNSEEECAALLELMTSDAAREFLSSFVFWDSKRPITAKLLNSLNLGALAQSLGMKSDVVQLLADRQRTRYNRQTQQRLLFGESESPAV